MILLKQCDEASQTLQEWWLKTELQAGAKVLAVQSDNRMKLRFILNDWCKSLDITLQYMMFYMSIQNDVVERVIWTTENSVCAMIKEAQLSIEFWVQAAQTDAYLCNWTVTDFLINGKQTTLKEAFIDVKSFINYIHVWGCKCYSYIDFKLLPEGRHDKFMNWGWVRVFMNYIEEITKQYQLWAPDLKCIIKNHTVKFAESKKGGTVNLRLQQQTLNVLLNRRLVECSWKKSIIVKITASDQALTTQNSKMQPDLIMVKVNKS